MELKVKRTSIYKSLVIENLGMSMDTGLLDKDECREMAAELRAAADQLDPDA